MVPRKNGIWTKSTWCKINSWGKIPTMQKNLNLKVKYRESFRPFAPSILREDLDSWFKINTDSPYMLLVG